MDHAWIAHCGGTWVGNVGAVEWYAADSATTARVQVKRPEKFFFIGGRSHEIAKPSSKICCDMENTFVTAMDKISILGL